MAFLNYKLLTITITIKLRNFIYYTLILLYNIKIAFLTFKKL